MALAINELFYLCVKCAQECCMQNTTKRSASALRKMKSLSILGWLPRACCPTQRKKRSVVQARRECIEWRSIHRFHCPKYIEFFCIYLCDRVCVILFSFLTHSKGWEKRKQKDVNDNFQYFCAVKAWLRKQGAHRFHQPYKREKKVVKGNSLLSRIPTKIYPHRIREKKKNRTQHCS